MEILPNLLAQDFNNDTNYNFFYDETLSDMIFISADQLKL